MGVPSTQIISTWVKDGLTDREWCPLRDAMFAVLRLRLTKLSEDEVWDLVEEKVGFVAECLRNDAAECLEDGMPAKFEIDGEQPPYVRAIGADDALLKKLRRIDPFVVEEVCAALLERLGATAKATQRTNDGGVDFIATNLSIVPAGFGMPAVCKATVIGQTKRYQADNVIVERSLREFVGSGVLQRHRLRLDSGISPLAPVILAFWTTSNFEPNAKKYARAMGIWYMDGHTLAAYVASVGLAEYVFSLPDAPARHGVL